MECSVGKHLLSKHTPWTTPKAKKDPQLVPWCLTVFQALSKSELDLENPHSLLQT